LLAALALEDRPLADPVELAARLEGWELGRRIDTAQAELARLDPDSQDYSAVFQELITWEKRRREIETRE
jgi:hypothetical protein